MSYLVIHICLILMLKTCTGVHFDYYYENEDKETTAVYQDTKIQALASNESDPESRKMAQNENVTATTQESVLVSNNTDMDEEESATAVHYDSNILHRLNEYLDYYISYNKTVSVQNQTHFDYNEDYELHEIHNRTKDKKYVFLREFYNLDAAVEHVKLMNVTLERDMNDTVWFTPESIPCWELPLIYGNVISLEKRHDIFMLRNRVLDNVKVQTEVHQNETTTTSAKAYFSYSASVMNKWCTMAPCFGDHTLCLFSGDSISNICENGYTVMKPSLQEKWAAINTINSMRNSVASATTKVYSHLPPAANMEQMMYDADLEKISQTWLRQCLPGPAPCSSIDNKMITQLECIKRGSKCCLAEEFKKQNCIPQIECLISPIVGCIHVWFESAGSSLTETDVKCGHASATTYNTVQMLWANTNKMGCAYGKYYSHNYRIICSFAPGASFRLETKYYCGMMPVQDITQKIGNFTIPDYTDENFLKQDFGLDLQVISDLRMSDKAETAHTKVNSNYSVFIKPTWGVDSLGKLYEENWVFRTLNLSTNGTRVLKTRIVTKYEFFEDSGSRCDSEEAVYEIGPTASHCMENGRRYRGLCYDFRDPTPGYRMVTVTAPIVLFSLILFDLFSSVARQAM